MADTLPVSGSPAAAPAATSTPAVSAASGEPAGTPPPAKRRRGCATCALVALALLVVMVLVVLPIVAVVVAVSGPQATVGRLGAGSVALIRLDGVIASSGDEGLFGSATASPESLIRQIRRAERMSSVKAILLRVNSPGGVASSGEEIAEAVRRAKKPVVVSIADVGASAAYMIASQADRIVATPSSMVGSIGVIMEVPNYQGLYEKLGISVVTLHEGKYKDIGNPARPMTDEERRFLQGQLKVTYEHFIGIVARGRKISTRRVRGLATGLFWTGTEAKRLGLVDEIGTYEDALTAAARAGGIKGDPGVIEMQRSTFWDALSESLAEGVRAGVREALGARLAAPTTR